MRKLAVLLLLVSAVLLLGGSVLAQAQCAANYCQIAGDPSYYFVTYYSNAHNAKAPDATLRIINDGDASTTEVEGVPNGNLWASIYVFDDSQELQECCNCFISADGILSESVNKELTANPLTPKLNTRGVIKVIASLGSDPTDNEVAAGLHGWMTHIQAFNVVGAGPYATTEAPLADANLVAAEKTALESLCSFTITLGSGHGICSCTAEDSDF